MNTTPFSPFDPSKGEYDPAIAEVADHLRQETPGKLTAVEAWQQAYELIWPDWEEEYDPAEAEAYAADPHRPKRSGLSLQAW